MKLVYFAWIRERIGLESEEIERPDGLTTVEALIVWLRERGPNYAHALEDDKAIRIAVDKEHKDRDADITDAREIAFFPPMTGG